MSTKGDKPFERKHSTFTVELIEALKRSKVLSTVHVDVRNESYWYLSRKRLRAKRHMKHVVTQNEATTKWESYIYKMEVRKSDYERVPTKVMLSKDHNSRVEALKHCEAMARERDQCPGDSKKLAGRVDPDKILNTHFRILIVSPAFERLDSNLRTALVYSELLKAFGFNAIPSLEYSSEPPPMPKLSRSVSMFTTSSSSSSPGKARSPSRQGSSTSPLGKKPSSRQLKRSDSISSTGSAGSEDSMSVAKNSFLTGSSCLSLDSSDPYEGPLLPTVTHSRAYYYAHCAPSITHRLTSTYGKNVCKLLLFRYFLPRDEQFPFELMVDARTPSQWKPTLYPPPLSERFGASHADKRASRLPKPAQKQPQMKRIKGLAAKITERDRQMGDFRQSAASAEFQQPTKQEEAATRNLSSAGSEDAGTGAEFPSDLTDLIAESLGVDPFISGMKMKKTGGIFGHHFHDMQEDVKEKVLKTAKDNKHLIKSEGFLAPLKTNAVAVSSGGSVGLTGRSTTTPRTGRLGDAANEKFPDINKHKQATLTSADDNTVANSEITSGMPIVALDAANSMWSSTTALTEANSSSVGTTSKKASRISRNNPFGKSKKDLSSAYATGAEYDKGTNTEHEMLTEMYCRGRQVEKCAIRLQRIWRIRTFHRSIRYLWRREYARITIQRVYRGHSVRNYYRLFKKIAPLASIRIQRSYRAYVGNKRLVLWRWLVYRMTRRILPKMKLFLKKCYESWMREHEHTAVVIQSVSRMFIYRNRYYKRLGEIYIRDSLIPWAATTIQRVMRGKWGRERFQLVIQAALVLKIDIPCCMRIQRCYRGCIGRRLAKQKRYELKACIRLQRNIRAFVWRKWKRDMAYEALRQRSATAIQKLFRGYFDRDLAGRRKQTHWYETVYIPSILKSQAIARMHQARVAFLLLKKKHRSAATIQHIYRKLTARAERLRRFRALYELKRIRCAIIMQKHVRRFLGRKGYKRALLARAGKRMLAGKVLIRAWKNYVYGKRLQILLDDNRLKILNEKAEKLKNARGDVHEDIADIKQDLDFLEKAIQRLKDRLKKVDTFLVEANMRIPVLQMELAKLSNEDFERGWAEAYGLEYESLNHMSNMATEEKRLLKSALMKKHKELLYLRCELEDAEWEHDEVAVLELANMETLRRSEVGRIERRVLDKYARALREERCRWQIESVRRNVIERNRKRVAALVKQVRNVAVLLIFSSSELELLVLFVVVYFIVAAVFIIYGTWRLVMSILAACCAVCLLCSWVNNINWLVTILRRLRPTEIPIMHKLYRTS